VVQPRSAACGDWAARFKLFLYSVKFLCGEAEARLPRVQSNATGALLDGDQHPQFGGEGSARAQRVIRWCWRRWFPGCEPKFNWSAGKPDMHPAARALGDDGRLLPLLEMALGAPLPSRFAHVGEFWKSSAPWS